MNLFWIKENRYYKIIFQPTLFGRTDVICVWGRIGGNLGNYKLCVKTPICLFFYLINKKID